MGFDYVDRRYAPKPLIRLECSQCGSDKDVAMAVSTFSKMATEGVPLCLKCMIRLQHYQWVRKA